MTNPENVQTTHSNKSLAIVGIGLVLLVIVAVLVYANMDNIKKTEQLAEVVQDEGLDVDILEREQNSMNQEETSKETSVSSNNAEKKIFTIEGNNYAFDLEEIKVKKGDTVRLNLTSTGGLHDIVIDEYRVASKKLNDGETDTVEFVADIAGEFEYYCSVGNHRQMGMAGKLTVEE